MQGDSERALNPVTEIKGNQGKTQSSLNGEKIRAKTSEITR